MSKSRQKNFRVEDDKYQDGYGVDYRKAHTFIDKRKEHRFQRALKVKDVNALLENDEDFDPYELQSVTNTNVEDIE